MRPDAYEIKAQIDESRWLLSQWREQEHILSGSDAWISLKGSNAPSATLDEALELVRSVLVQKVNRLPNRIRR